MSNPPLFNCLMAFSAAECWLKTATTEFWSCLGVLLIVRLLILIFAIRFALVQVCLAYSSHLSPKLRPMFVIDPQGCEVSSRTVAAYPTLSRDRYHLILAGKFVNYCGGEHRAVHSLE